MAVDRAHQPQATRIHIEPHGPWRSTNEATPLLVLQAFTTPSRADGVAPADAETVEETCPYTGCNAKEQYGYSYQLHPATSYFANARTPSNAMQIDGFLEPRSIGLILKSLMGAHHNPSTR